MEHPNKETGRRYEVGAYYFPNYHLDPRNEADHGSGWTEWDLVRTATPRFPGHEQPKVPLWGEEDEADPAVMARKIDAAADHGLNHWIWDWYWYNDGPFLQRALDEGFLQAPNRNRLKFALMWANHNWNDIHPAKYRGPRNCLYPGAVTRETWDRFGDHIVANYFTQPNYWTVDGAPYFSIYELMLFVQGMGGIDGARAAIDSLRAKARAAGLPGVHVNAVVWGIRVLPGEQAIEDPNALLEALGCDSISSYVWVHHVGAPSFPVTPYADVLRDARAHWERSRRDFRLPFHPNVTMGWDASPRTVQTDRFDNVGYPFMATYGGNTPDAFEAALREAKAFLDAAPANGGTGGGGTGDDAPRILSLNAWNEWTEGSYLEPDTVHGFGYLEAIRRVFGTEG